MNPERGKLGATWRRKLVVLPLLLACVLSGCTIPIDQQSNPLNPLKNVVTTIPWTRSIADDVSAQELQARIAELKATLPTLDISPSTKGWVSKKLEALSAQIAADPASSAANARTLRTIIDEVKAAASSRH